MKKLLIALTIALFLISCDSGDERKGIPEIKSFRVLGDDGSGGYVEKDEFARPEHPYLEFAVYDDDLDIENISIALKNDTYPSNDQFFLELNQETNPQIYMFQIEINRGYMFGLDNYWYLQFFVTDKKGNKSKSYTSNKFRMLES